ncbi:MAG: DUF3025 domain-containing protein [Psychrobium sp.]|nr:DUF3025 domain-containing protein [Psychrobium sp.]
MQQWRSDFFKLSPIFGDLKQILNDFNWSTWPSCQQLNHIIPSDVVNYQGQRLTLIEQTEQLLSDGLYYEERIYRTGQVPTRYGNWHDFFNAMILTLFPLAKKEINRLHFEHIQLFGQKKRSKCRDALTLFDECGVIVPYADDNLRQALMEHQWQDAFFEQRDQWGQNIDALIFGHANYEKAMTPYIGFTGKALYVKVSVDFFQQPLLKKYEILDQILAQNIEELLQDNKQLFPFPMLGVPGWWDENQHVEFYDNRDYFRAKRIK